ncbi:PcfJ domain-containing protein [Rhizobium johnstonii]|uniref:PcfJ domain-containing protein n=1 Tax=Rhizobium johnstonii TaxID=3019933 RepID=UPI003F9771F5
MAKITDQELRAARLALARELDVDRHNAFNFHELFFDSVARVYVNWWLKEDVDNGVIYDVGADVRVDGWQYGGDQSQEAVLKRKWEARAMVFVVLHRDDIRHVVDWLEVSAAEMHPWTQRRDGAGHVPKLMKASTIRDLAREADKWLRQAPAVAAELEPYDPSEHELPFHDLGAGYTLVRLLTARALDQETAVLRHCVGHGAYDELVSTGRAEIYSVRAPNGTPEATVEIRVDGDNRYLTQFRAAKNAKPERHVRDLVVGAMADLGWSERKPFILWGEPAAIRHW